ncbi:MAG: PAS domain S-box protein, partial [Magnetococcales bacterium]|nr:PAS domain S-box protein [Magnetococcales bacterium]
VAGSVDVIPGYVISTPLAANHAGIKLRSLVPQNYGINFYGDSIFTTANLFKSKPELVAKFVKASIKGWEYALNNPYEVANRINKEKTQLNQTLFSKQLNFFQIDVVNDLILHPKIKLGTTNPERWRHMYQDLTYANLVSGNLDIDKMIVSLDQNKVDSEDSFYLNLLYILSGGSMAFAIIIIGIMAKKTSSGNLLAGGFFAMVVLMTILEVGALWTASTLSDLNTKMYQHPFTVNNHVHEANRNIISIHRYMKDVANASNQQDLKTAISRVNYEVKEVHRHLNLVRDRFLGDLSKIDNVRRTFNYWETIRNEVIMLIEAGQNKQAADITKGKGAKHVALLNIHMNELSEFAKTKAAQFHKHSKKVYLESKTTLFILISVILFLAALISIFIIVRVKHSEERIREGEERFRVALMNSPILVFSQDRDLRYKWVFNQDQQYGSKSVIGKTDAQLLVDTDVTELTKFKNDVLDRGVGKRQEFTFKQANGEHTIDLTCEPIKNPKGDIVGITGASTDISERVAINKLLYLTKFSFDNSADAFLWVNRNGLFVHINQTTCNLLGYSHKEMLALGVADLDSTMISEKWEKHWQTVKEKQTHVIKVTLQKKDGSTFPAQATIRHLDYIGEELHLTRLIDLTEQELEDQKRQQSQKIQAIGTLAGGIAHDFNNILGIIMGNAELLDLEAKKTNGSINNILEASRRGRDLISQLLTFSRKKQTKKSIISPAPLIKEALKLMRSTTPSSIEIRTEIADENIKIFGDPTQLHQVIMNLCTNANHAMGERGGILSITINSVVLDSQKAKKLSIEPGSYAEIKIKDTGSGMSKEVQERIFEPFFSTKSDTKGTGLGLSVILGAVQDCDGYINVESRPDIGSIFTLFIPLAQTQPAKNIEDNSRKKIKIEEIITVSKED